MAKIFISYSRDDKAVIEKLATTLEAKGHDVWWDRHIKAGSMYEKDIESALHNCDSVVVVWRPVRDRFWLGQR